jgi:hypothetical protein
VKEPTEVGIEPASMLELLLSGDSLDSLRELIIE